MRTMKQAYTEDDFKKEFFSLVEKQKAEFYVFESVRHWCKAPSQIELPYRTRTNHVVKAFIQGHNLPVNDDVFALNMMLQWLFRGCIRKKGDEKLKVAILSRRMSILFKRWLMENQV